MKFGTIGSGMIVHRILEGIAAAPGVSCEAVYSRTEEKGRALAEQYGVKKVYTDLSQMLADPEIDWIYVASPNSLHYAHTMAALAAGKNVLCEKPFASNAREAQEMADLAEEKGLYLYEAYTTGFLAHFALLKQLLPKLGRLRLALASYSQYSSRYDALLAGQRTNVFDPNFSGGSLMDINYYNVAMVVSLFGEPERVYFAGNLNGGVDTSGIALLQYKDFVCQCTGAKDTWGENIIQLQGEKGYLYIEGGSNGLTRLRLVTRESEEVSDEIPEPERWINEIAVLSQLVAANEREDCRRRLRCSLATMRTIDRLRESAGIVFPADGRQP